MDKTLKRTDTVFDLYQFTDKLTFYVVDKFDMFNPTKSVTNNIEKVVQYVLDNYVPKSKWDSVQVCIYYRDTLEEIDQVFWEINTQTNQIHCSFVADVNPIVMKANRKEYITNSLFKKELILIENRVIV